MGSEVSVRLLALEETSTARSWLKADSCIEPEGCSLTMGTTAEGDMTIGRLDSTKFVAVWEIKV